MYVGPKLIEKILLTHPDVEEVLVCAIPDDEDGNRPFALVVKKEGSIGLTAVSILSYSDKLLENHQRLKRGIKIVDHIPNTESRCRRKVISEMIQSRKI